MRRIRYESTSTNGCSGIPWYQYASIDVKTTKEVLNTMKSSIEKVIFNPPATISYFGAMGPRRW